MAGEPESLLAIDLGHTYLKASLIDRVAGQHRFVGRTVAPRVASVAPDSPPQSCYAALGELERLSGRLLVDEDGLLQIPESYGTGVDGVAAVVTDTVPMRLGLVGLRRDRSWAYAEGAARAIAADVVCSIDYEALRLRGDTYGDFAHKLRELRPHAVVVVGGPDARPDRAVIALVEAVAVASTLLRSDERPLLLYAGPAALRQAVVGAVGERMAVRMVHNPASDPNSPSPLALRTELDAIAMTSIAALDPDLQHLREVCQGQVVSVGQALLRAYGQGEVDILAADVGSDQTVLVRTSHNQVLVETGCGVGGGAAALLGRVGAEGLARWMDMDADEATRVASEWCLNRRFHPWTLPTSDGEQAADRALAREALGLARRRAVASWPEEPGPGKHLLPRVELIVGSGAVAGRFGTPAQAAGALIDGLQPVGVSRLALDRDGLGPSLGALAQLNPDAVRSALERDALLMLGTLIAPLGDGRGRGTVLEVNLSGAGTEPRRLSISPGELQRVSLLPSVVVRAVLKPARGWDVGAGPGRELEAEVEGGALGLVIDTRGRPLPDTAASSRWAEAVRRWAAALEAG